MAVNKQAELTKLNNRFEALVREVYSPHKKVTVLGEGNADAVLMLIGEAPGEQETLQRRPFVGKAGQNLSAFLEKLELNREDIYITNVVKFRPYKENPRTGTLSNRPPTREEIELCRSLLEREIELLAPRLLITLGNTALRTVLDDTKVSIGSMHGAPSSFVFRGVPTVLFPLYHPASIIYNRKLAGEYEKDLDALKAFLASSSPA
jgi:DNA polymerase